jgi:hypothetical protein
MRLRRAGYLEKFPFCRFIKHEGVPHTVRHGPAGSLRNQGCIGAVSESAQDFTLSACLETITANSPCVGRFGRLDSLGNDRSDPPRHCSRDRVRAGPPFHSGTEPASLSDALSMHA